jgi:O-antigen/teichoic acid export membrane protein
METRAGATTTRPRISQLGAHTFAAGVTIYASGFASSVLIARALGPDGRGVYVLAVTIATLAALFGSLGVEPSQVRLWARRQASRDQFETGAAVLSATLGIAAAALAWFVYQLGRSSFFEGVEPVEVAIVLALVPFRIHSTLLRSLLVLGGRLTTANVAMVIGDLARTCAVLVLFITVGLSVELALVLYGAIVLVPWALMLRSPARTGRIRGPVPWRLIGSQLKVGVQIAPYALFLYLNLRLDIFLIAEYLGPGEVGVYSVAVLFSEAIWLATNSLVQSIKERQANAPRPEALGVTAQAVRMNLLIALGGGLVLALVAPVSIGLIYGDAFTGAAPAVWALVPASAAMAVWRTAAVALFRFDRPWHPPLIGLIALSTNVVANVLLIPPLGLAGAGLASTASYGSAAALSCAFVLRSGTLSSRSLFPGIAELRQLLDALRPRSVREQLRFLRAGRV